MQTLGGMKNLNLLSRYIHESWCWNENLQTVTKTKEAYIKNRQSCTKKKTLQNIR